MSDRVNISDATLKQKFHLHSTCAHAVQALRDQPPTAQSSPTLARTLSVSHPRETRNQAGAPGIYSKDTVASRLKTQHGVGPSSHRANRPGQPTYPEPTDLPPPATEEDQQTAKLSSSQRNSPSAAGRPLKLASKIGFCLLSFAPRSRFGATISNFCLLCVVPSCFETQPVQIAVGCSKVPSCCSCVRIAT